MGLAVVRRAGSVGWAASAACDSGGGRVGDFQDFAAIGTNAVHAVRLPSARGGLLSLSSINGYGCLVAEISTTMRLAHINLVARNAKALAAFYISVMKCESLREPKVLSGERVSRGNRIANSEIFTIWLKFPELERALSWKYMSTGLLMTGNSQR